MIINMFVINANKMNLTEDNSIINVFIQIIILLVLFL